jgi:DNA topoisomerase-1
LHKTFPDLLRADFTAGMETTLDEISVGKLEWQSYLIGWHQSYFQPMLARAYRTHLVSRVYATSLSGV